MNGTNGGGTSDPDPSDSATRPAPARQAAAEGTDAPPPKTAVVLIHGMGEQRPMATLWGFVDAIWSTDRDLVESYDAPIYAKPDTINDSVDLRRVTTRYWKEPTPRRVDFFEYYWAHMMRGNSVRGTVEWIVSLFLRSPSSVPRGLRGVWLAGLVFLLAALVLFALVAISRLTTLKGLDPNLVLALGVLSSGFSFAAARWLAPIAGDAARYFSPDPDNVEARQKIIRTGVDVIEKLTASGAYDRIIVVGHSLGSAIGLDILNQAFGRVSPEKWARAHADPATAEALAALEKRGADLNEASLPAPDEWRAAQARYAACLRRGWNTGEAPWLVSDLVTMGSPLSKADVLLARTLPGFELLLQRRQAPSCPPVYERAKPPRFSFSTRGSPLIPHFGAVFAPTRWTNLFFKSHALVFGDIISGPVAPLFGAGVQDVALPQPGLRFRHLDYWRGARTDPPSPWIPLLREAVNLRGDAIAPRLAADTELAAEAGTASSRKPRSKGKQSHADR